MKNYYEKFLSGEPDRDYNRRIISKSAAYVSVLGSEAPTQIPAKRNKERKWYEAQCAYDEV